MFVVLAAGGPGFNFDWLATGWTWKVVELNGSGRSF